MPPKLPDTPLWLLSAPIFTANLLYHDDGFHHLGCFVEAEAKAEPAKPPQKRQHRDMAYMAFAVPETPTQTEPPRYTLQPHVTKIPCRVETKTVLDVESIAAAIVTGNVFDSETMQHRLIPQGATIGGRYASKDLVYGNQRLPMCSTELVIPGQAPIDWENTPLLTQEGSAGLVSRVDNHFWRAVPAVLISGVLKGNQQAVYQGGRRRRGHGE